MLGKGSPADRSEVPTLFVSMSHIYTWPLFWSITERLDGESSISYPKLLGSCQIIYFSQCHCYTQNSGHIGYRHGEGNATHSSSLVWKTPRTEEPVGLQSMGPKRVGHH